MRIQRRGRVRSWSLPEGMHLRAGRLTAAQTGELMQALKEGSVAAEADRVVEAPTAPAPRSPPPLPPATAPRVGGAAAAAASPTPTPLGAFTPHRDLSNAGEAPASATPPRGRGRGRGRGGRGLGLLPSAISSGAAAGGGVGACGQLEADSKPGHGGVARQPVYRARPTAGLSTEHAPPRACWLAPGSWPSSGVAAQQSRELQPSRVATA